MKMNLLHSFAYLFKNDINEIYMTISLRTIFSAMVAIFIPIYLFVIGIPLYYIPVYYLFKAAIGIPLSLGVRSAMSKVKAPVLVGASSIAYSVFLMHLGNAEITLGVLALLALESEAANLMFWIPFHHLFAAASGKKLDKEFGIRQSLASFAPLVSPLIAALIIVNFGYGNLFMFASTGMIVSAIPLFFIKKELRITHAAVHMPKISAKYFVEGIRSDSLAIYWPLYMFVALGSIGAIGEIATSAAIAGGIAMIVVGYVDNFGLHKTFRRVGGVLHSLTIVVRGFVSSFAGILGTMVGATITHSILISPYLVEFYEKMRKEDSVLIEREVNLRNGRIIANLLFIVLLFLLPQNLLYALFFIIISPVSILIGFLK